MIEGQIQFLASFCIAHKLRVALTFLKGYRRRRDRRGKEKERRRARGGGRKEEGVKEKEEEKRRKKKQRPHPGWCCSVD